jgi:hypothetical protein
MKKIERICNRIIAMQEKRQPNEYKTEILKACQESKDEGYLRSPYELMFMKSWLPKK